MNILTVLNNYQPKNEQEIVDKEIMIDAINTFDDIYNRDCKLAHITASAWVLNKTRDKVLMVYHNIYQSWSWSGGHADGCKDLSSVALKEVKEETGLSVELLSDDLFAIDVLDVCSHYKKGAYVNAHLHLNFTYLCVGDDTLPLKKKEDENSAVGWISIDEIDEAVKEKKMLPVYHKLIQASKG